MKTSYNTIVYKIPEVPSSIIPAGNGSKGLVVAIAQEDASGVEMETLRKMIAAIRYDMEEDAVILAIPTGSQFPLSSWDKEWKDLLVFGLTPSVLGLQIENLQEKILVLENKRALFCPSLKEINGSIPKKQTLWRLLQEMFLHTEKGQ